MANIYSVNKGASPGRFLQNVQGVALELTSQNVIWNTGAIFNEVNAGGLGNNATLLLVNGLFVQNLGILVVMKFDGNNIGYVELVLENQNLTNDIYRFLPELDGYANINIFSTEFIKDVSLTNHTNAALGVWIATCPGSLDGRNPRLN